MKSKVFSLAFLAVATLIGCKKDAGSQWSEADVESLFAGENNSTRPPQNILAQVLIHEREFALKIFDTWAKKFLANQKSNRSSPLNQLRLIFNPDYLNPLGYEEALSQVRNEGSGRHGILARELKPQDRIYHAVWSRIADAAGLARYPLSSRHMKHYLQNSGKEIRYEAAESNRIFTAAEGLQDTPPDPVGIQVTRSQLQEDLKKRGFQLSLSEATHVAEMNRNERGFFVARMRVRIALAKFVQSQNISTGDELEIRLGNLKNKTFPQRNKLDSNAWKEYRPVGEEFRLVSSVPQSDLYFALGSFTATHQAIPVELRAEGEQIKMRFAQSKSLYDRYNWDNGKFVTLLSGWCWNLQSNHCANIEELISLQVSDKSLGRLHKLGIAREYEIFGQSSVSTVWDGFSFADLRSAQKEKLWEALTSVVSAPLTASPALIPD
ncbi:MAG: hypothetical protein EBT78_14210 [Betaproteobacteria bacterium]|nr:hypothetical protein [Betaproteobacteria bacterium]